MLDPSTAEGRLVASALKLAAERPWRDITLLDVAEAAGMVLADVKPIASSKSGLLAALARTIDAEVLRRAPKRQPGQVPRDALFEIVMSRFDLLEPHKKALRSIMDAPALEPAMLTSLFNSQRWMLEAAGIDLSGAAGAARVVGLASTYASVARIWLEDDDPGLARTMAALDRRLRSGERTLSTIEDAFATLGRFTGIFAPRKPATPKTPPPPTAESGPAP